MMVLNNIFVFQAKTMLEKALASNASFLPAAYLLVDILMKARHFEAAIVLLVAIHL